MFDRLRAVTEIADRVVFTPKQIGMCHMAVTDSKTMQDGFIPSADVSAKFCISENRFDNE